MEGLELSTRTHSLGTTARSCLVKQLYRIATLLFSLLQNFLKSTLWLWVLYVSTSHAKTQDVTYQDCWDNDKNCKDYSDQLEPMPDGPGRTDTEGVLRDAPSIWGIGVSVKCRAQMDVVFNSTTEFDKAGSAAAATLMTLLPTLLAFGPLKTADIRMQFYLDTDAALFTSAMTMCNPVRHMNTLRKERIFTVSEFINRGPQILSDTGPERIVDKSIQSTTTHEAQSLATVQTIDQPTTDFGSLIKIVKKSQEQGSRDLTDTNSQKHRISRPSRFKVQVVVYGFLILQVGLWLTIALGLFNVDWIFFIWACINDSAYIFMWWLAGSAGLSILRTFINSSYLNPDEVFHLSYLSSELKEIEVLRCPNQLRHTDIPQPEDCTGTWASSSHGRLKGELAAIGGWIFGGGHWKIFKLAFRVLRLVVKARTQESPMVVVLRPTAEFRKPSNPVLRHMIAYIELIILLFVSLVFGSTFGGTLLYTLAFIVGFMTTIAISRLSSILLSMWLERRLDMHIIEYENKDDYELIKTTIINLGEDILVESRTGNYKYVEGYRQDTNCPISCEHCHDHIERRNALRVICAGFGIIMGTLCGGGIGVIMAFIWKYGSSCWTNPVDPTVNCSDHPTGSYIAGPVCAFIGFCIFGRRFWHMFDMVSTGYKMD